MAESMHIVGAIRRACLLEKRSVRCNLIPLAWRTSWYKNLDFQHTGLSTRNVMKQRRYYCTGTAVVSRPWGQTWAWTWDLCGTACRKKSSFLLCAESGAGGRLTGESRPNFHQLRSLDATTRTLKHRYRTATWSSPAMLGSCRPTSRSQS